VGREHRALVVGGGALLSRLFRSIALATHAFRVPDWHLMARPGLATVEWTLSGR